MNIVVITTLSRPQLLAQTIASLIDNAVKPMSHHYTVVLDDYGSALMRGNLPREEVACDVMINLAGPNGASRARNIGAGSIPKYRRQEHVMFCDDDIYACPGWDTKLSELALFCDDSIISGYSHPFNQCDRMDYNPEHGVDHGRPLVISSVAMMMPWHIFDKCGPWDEPGGPGGSEDYALCMRAKVIHYGFAVTDPQCIIHTGMTSSSGQFIVGFNELGIQNAKLIERYGLQGKVEFA